MSQAWVFRKDDYEKLLHKLKGLAERVEELEKKHRQSVKEPGNEVDHGKHPEHVAALK